MKNNNTLEFTEEFYKILNEEAHKLRMNKKAFIKFLVTKHILDETNKKYEDRRG